MAIFEGGSSSFYLFLFIMMIALVIIQSTLFILAEYRRRRMLNSGELDPKEINKIVTQDSDDCERIKSLFKSPKKKIFSYLDSDIIDSLYSQVITEPIPKSVEVRETQGNEKQISADLKIATPKIGVKKTTDVTRVYNEDESPTVKTNKVINALVSADEVAFGLDQFSPDQSEIDKFHEMAHLMESETGFVIPEEFQEKYIAEKQRKLALEKVVSIFETTEIIGLHSDFTVNTKDSGERYLSLDHPLNPYLLEKETKISIEINLIDDKILSPGKSMFTNGHSAKIFCLGKITERNRIEGKLIVCPVAIY